MRARRVNEDEEVRYTNIPINLDDRYHRDKNGNILGLKDNKEEARKRKREDAIKRIEQSAIFRIKFPATSQGVEELEDWADKQGETTDYVLRPIDLPLNGIGEIVVYDDELGAGTKITDDLRKDYAIFAEEGNYYNVSPITLDHWKKLDSTHKMRSRIESRRKKKDDILPDIIGKHD